MAATPMTAAPFVPSSRNLRVLAAASQECRGCDLYEYATQAVFGDGPSHALVMLVGEQPGDQEDQQGKPFVGPAGKLLDRALVEAGVDRDLVYVTNAVKHFKFEERGKRRLHKKPSGLQIRACNPWLEAEIRAVEPKVLVPMGATAILAVLGKDAKLTRDRGRFFPHPSSADVLPTIHPSALLRMPEQEKRHEEFARFVEDLKLVRKRMQA
jgi:uracil-DNA glycosylase family protein